MAALKSNQIQFFAHKLIEDFDTQYECCLKLTNTNTNELSIFQPSEDSKASEAFKTRSKLQRSPENIQTASQQLEQERLERENDSIRFDFIFEKEEEFFEKISLNLTKFNFGSQNIIIININNRIQISFLNELTKKFKGEFFIEYLVFNNENGKLEEFEKWYTIDEKLKNLPNKKSDLLVYRIKRKDALSLKSKYVVILDLYQIFEKNDLENLNNNAKIIKNIMTNGNIEQEIMKEKLIRIIQKTLGYELKIFFIVNLRTTSPFFIQNKEIYKYIKIIQKKSNKNILHGGFVSLLFNKEKKIEEKSKELKLLKEKKHDGANEALNVENAFLKMEIKELKKQVISNNELINRLENDKSQIFDSPISLNDDLLIKVFFYNIYYIFNKEKKFLLSILEIFSQNQIANSEIYSKIFENLKLNSDKKINNYLKREAILLNLLEDEKNKQIDAMNKDSKKIFEEQDNKMNELTEKYIKLLQHVNLLTEKET